MRERGRKRESYPSKWGKGSEKVFPKASNRDWEGMRPHEVDMETSAYKPTWAFLSD